MRIKSPWLTRLLTALAVRAVELVYATTRLRVIVSRPEYSPYVVKGDVRFLYCIWHDDLLSPIFADRPRNMAALISGHRDGGYVAEGAARRGIRIVRGSSTRNGAAASRALLEAARGLHVAITPDGPRGPRREVKDGIVWLASRTGRTIMPVACAARRCWRIRASWTDLMVPKPFTTVYALGGEPISVPPDCTREEIEQWRQVVQRAMEELHERAARYAAGEAVEPAAAPQPDSLQDDLRTAA